MRLRRFLLLDLVGTSLWVALVVGLGFATGRPAVHVIKEITHYSLLLAIPLTLAALAALGLRVRRAKTLPTLYGASEQEQL